MESNAEMQPRLSIGLESVRILYACSFLSSLCYPKKLLSPLSTHSIASGFIRSRPKARLAFNPSVSQGWEFSPAMVGCWAPINCNWKRAGAGVQGRISPMPIVSFQRRENCYVLGRHPTWSRREAITPLLQWTPRVKHQSGSMAKLSSWIQKQVKYLSLPSKNLTAGPVNT